MTSAEKLHLESEMAVRRDTLCTGYVERWLFLDVEYEKAESRHFSQETPLTRRPGRS
jgi:hypothetical protein